MQRIAADGHINNRFTDGNPQAGQEATIVAAAWLNSVQEEIANVIELAGGALNPALDNQLYNALVALVAGAVGTGGASVPTTRQITGAGLLAGQGGNLAADRVFTLTPATIGEVAAQARNDVAVTPAGLAGLASLTGTGGFVLRVGNAIIQFATGIASPNTSTLFTLPTTFPNACFAAFANGGEQAASADDNPCFANGWGVNYVSVYSSVRFGVGCNVIAFGY